jgi:hypothetical protein
MNHATCSLGVLLLWMATAVAAPAPFPRPARAERQLTVEQLERQLEQRGIRVTDVKQVGPSTWVVTFPEFRGGCLVGRPPTGSVRVEAPNHTRAVHAFLHWYREQEEQRLRLLRAVGAIR